MAEFIARADFLYDRNIYVPFAVGNLYPLLKDKDKRNNFGIIQRYQDYPNQEDDLTNKENIRNLPYYLNHNQMQYY